MKKRKKNVEPKPPKGPHGGRREGSGRKRRDTKAVNIRLTEADHVKLMTLGGSAWVVSKLAEVQMHDYYVEDAISRAGGPLEDEIKDCYVDGFEFQAENDEAAWAHVEKLQEKHDRAAWKIVEKAKAEESPRAFALESSWDVAPCYTNHLYRVGEVKDVKINI